MIRRLEGGNFRKVASEMGRKRLSMDALTCHPELACHRQAKRGICFSESPEEKSARGGNKEIEIGNRMQAQKERP